MNKNLIIFGIAVLIVCVWLSGCDSIKGNSLEGTWIGNMPKSYNIITISITEFTFTDSSSVYMSYETEYVGTSTVSGTYETEGDKLLITFQNGESLSFTYIINGNKLFLDGSEFTKQ